MPPPRPTHHVKHKDGWEANIYIAPSLQNKLNSRLDDIRSGARSSVCIRFRSACKEKYDTWPYEDPHPYINWNDLLITQIVQPVLVPSGPINTSERHCCDDDNCVVCDIGNHHHCRNCTLFG